MTTIISSSFLRISRGNFTRLQLQLRRAREEARNAYSFNPNSYTYGMLSALSAVVNTFESCFGPDDFDIEGHGEAEVWGASNGS
jgi:hypothetical protein